MTPLADEQRPHPADADADEVGPVHLLAVPVVVVAVIADTGADIAPQHGVDDCRRIDQPLVPGVPQPEPREIHELQPEHARAWRHEIWIGLVGDAGHAPLRIRPDPDVVAASVEELVEPGVGDVAPVSYTHLRAHETVLDIVCRLLLEKKKKPTINNKNF